MSNKEEKLFSQFIKNDRNDWENVASSEIKGVDLKHFIDKIKSRFHGVHPYSVAEDSNELPIAEFEKIFSEKENKSWLIRQNINISEIQTHPDIISDSIKGGINSMGIDLENKVLSPQFLEMIYSIPNIDKVELNFYSVRSYLESIQILHNFVALRFDESMPFRGSFGFNPIGDLLENRIETNEYENRIGELKTSLPLLNLPHFKIQPFVINAQGTKSKPTQPAHELAFQLASAYEYMHLLTEAGKTSDEAASLIKMEYSIGFEYFVELAKLLAARILWAKLMEGFAAQKRESYFACIHAECSAESYFHENRYDNLISGTTQAMSAVFGGCDSFSIAPFNGFSDFSLRITRNIQIIMKEEAFMDKVSNPAGGSWFIEKLTWEMVKTAWEVFQKIQVSGGLMEVRGASKMKD